MEKILRVRTTFFPLIDSIISHAQNHKAYSVLHFFHSSDRREAFVLNITNLDELLTVLLLNISEEQRPSQYTYQAQEGYIELPHNTTSNLYNSRKKNPPLVLTTLKDKGIKIISGEKVDLDYEKLRTRRRLLLSSSRTTDGMG
jgi:hypothetical protein